MHMETFSRLVIKILGPGGRRKMGYRVNDETYQIQGSSHKMIFHTWTILRTTASDHDDTMLLNIVACMHITEIQLVHDKPQKWETRSVRRVSPWHKKYPSSIPIFSSVGDGEKEGGGKRKVERERKREVSYPLQEYTP